MNRKRINIGYLYAIAVGVICGIIPVIIQKVLTQDPIPRATALFIKFAGSALILLPFTAPKIKKVQIPQGFGWKLPVATLFYVATLVFLYESYRYIPTGIGVSLQYTFPLFTMGFSVLFFGFRCTKQSVVAMVLSLVGAMLLSSGTITSDRAYIGIILGIGCAVAYAAYFLWVEHQKLAAMDTTVFVALKTCLSAVFLFIYILVTKQLTFSISFQTLLGLLLSGGCTILASIFLTLAIRHIGSVHTSILGSIEPIVCAVAGFFVLGETISLRSSIGIAVVLIAAIMVTLSKQGAKTETEESAKFQGKG
ncbi:MAG: DMT family transporter [Oscillospiraceae bacterium]|nr:DMT family transporter [Oscillospiraceae bacterium]